MKPLTFQGRDPIYLIKGRYGYHLQRGDEQYPKCLISPTYETPADAKLALVDWRLSRGMNRKTFWCYSKVA